MYLNAEYEQSRFGMLCLMYGMHAAIRQNDIYFILMEAEQRIDMDGHVQLYSSPGAV